MKKNILIIFIVIFLIISTVVFLTKRKRIPVLEHDGYHWISLQSSYKKATFLKGYLTAIFSFRNTMLEISSMLSSHFQLLEQFKNVMTSRLEELNFKGITEQQLIEGLDKFYEDSSNRKIKIIDALVVVKMQIMREKPDLIDAQIRYLRMQPITEHLKYTIIEGVDKMDLLRYMLEKGIIYPMLTKEDYLILGYFIDEKENVRRLSCYGKYD